MDAPPLVSCIMPTYNRRHFVPRAIEYFLRQDYEPKELIVVDDGQDSVADLMPDDSRIRYFRLNEKLTLGAKLNLACEYALGDVIALWDDDDWYAAHRLSYQVPALRPEKVDMCGINQLLYYDLQTGRAYKYIYPSGQRIWLSALCYFKAFWAKHRFADIQVGMDAKFVWSADPRRVLPLTDCTFAVHTIHAHNVSPKRTEGAYWHPFPVEEITSILEHDWNFYQSAQMEKIEYVQAQKGNSNRVQPTVITTDLEGSPVKPLRNVFACLVHENQECVIDLVRNLKYFDPGSTILLYNGGKDHNLLNHGYPFERHGAVMHPDSKPAVWGQLHSFALDCMQFALENIPFDTFTIVDSDQLALRSNYSAYLAHFMKSRTNVGLLGNLPERLHPNTSIGPAAAAFKEIDLWRPYLQRFKDGQQKFVHWSFWPSTVFTAGAARDLVALFKTDSKLQEIMRRSKIWATEEVIFPTLVALLGYDILANPCSYEYVKFRQAFGMSQFHTALAQSDVFWMHPVPRRYDDPLRKQARSRFNHYNQISNVRRPDMLTTTSEVLLTLPILNQMKAIEGWLEEDEADLLIAASARMLAQQREQHNIVEIGSYCGRSTVVMGTVAKTIRPGTKLYAIDPHDGKVGDLDQGIRTGAPTLEKFRRNIAQANLTDIIETIQQHSFEVMWDKPISLLFIDGLHDYVNVSRDFFHFESCIVPGGYVAFHDYADYYPGVQALVNEVLVSQGYRYVAAVRSMIVLEKLPVEDTQHTVD
jgi:hypothetical protein